MRLLRKDFDKMQVENMIVKTCRWCGSEFHTTNPRALYCRDSHKVLACRAGMTNGNAFEPFDNSGESMAPQAAPQRRNTQPPSWLTETKNYFDQFQKTA